MLGTTHAGLNLDDKGKKHYITKFSSQPKVCCYTDIQLNNATEHITENFI